MSKLSGKNLIITGGARGIGRAIAGHCIREGAFVGITYCHSRVEAEELKDRFPDQVDLLEFDVANHTAAQNQIGGFAERRGSLHALINNAGVHRPKLLLRNNDLSECPEEIRVNLLGTIICTQAALRWMLKSKGGIIINLSSCAAVQPESGQSIYAASKAGIEAFGRAIALEYATKGIYALSIRLGIFDTDMFRATPEEVQSRIKNRTLLKRACDPSELADFVLALLSGSAAHASGSVLDLTAGYGAC